jgi:hypothetical protein
VSRPPVKMGFRAVSPIGIKAASKVRPSLGRIEDMIRNYQTVKLGVCPVRKVGFEMVIKEEAGG